CNLQMKKLILSILLTTAIVFAASNVPNKALLDAKILTTTNVYSAAEIAYFSIHNEYNKYPTTNIDIVFGGSLSFATINYIGPFGKGYQFVSIYTDTTNGIWTRLDHIGPETNDSCRQQDWTYQK